MRRIRFWLSEFGCEIALLLPAALPYLTGAISGSLSAVADNFPDIPDIVIRLVGSISSISSIACGLLSSMLIKKISTKKILQGYLSLSFLGGLLAFVFSNNIYFLLAASLLTGFSGGLIPICAIMIDQMFSDNKVYTLLGSQYSVCCFGGIVIMIISSILSTFGYRYVYILFLLIIPVMILVDKEIEEIPASKQDSIENRTDIKKLISLNYVICCLFSMIYYAADRVWGLNFAFVLSSVFGTGNRLGNIPNIFSCLGGFIAGNIYNKLYKRFKDGVFLMGVAILLFGLLAVAIMPGVFTIFVCGFCSGFSMSITLPYASLWARESVPEKYASDAISIVNMFINLGAFFTPFVFGTKGIIFSKAGLIRPFIISCFACIMLGVSWFAVKGISKKSR